VIRQQSMNLTMRFAADGVKLRTEFLLRKSEGRGAFWHVPMSAGEQMIFGSKGQ
jgi:hypothetical protein